MSTLEKLLWPTLKVDGSDYLTWITDVETYFAFHDLEDTVDTDANLTMKQKAKAVFLICQHLVPQLKNEYMNEMNPCKLWEQLKAQFDHMREIWLPDARRDWHNL